MDRNGCRLRYYSLRRIVLRVAADARLDVTDLRKTHHLTHPREKDEQARGR